MGLGGRLIADSLADGFVHVHEHADTCSLIDAHMQDERGFMDGSLTDLKPEHNDATGLETLPNLRLLEHVSLNHTVWVAWSHAVRTPTRFETNGWMDARIYAPGVVSPDLPLVIRASGNPSLHLEVLDSYDAGWRWQCSSRPW